MEYTAPIYYIHCLYANWSDKRSVYYLRVSPDYDNNTPVYAHKLSSRRNSIGIEAVFSSINASQLYIGQNNSYLGYQAYWVGSKNEYDVKPSV